MANRKSSWSTGRTALTVVATLPFLYPFAYLVGTALKSNVEYTLNPAGIPSHVTTANFSAAWSIASLGPAMLHSLVAVSVGVVVTVLISCLGGFFFLLHRGRLASVLRIGVVGTIAIPPPVFIIPLYILLNGWNLTSNLIVLGFVYAAWNGGFGLYLMYAYFQRGVPSEVLESSEIDGASHWKQFRHIVLPLSRSAVATLAVLTFVWSWSDLLLAIVLIQNPSSRTLVPATTLLTGRYNSSAPINDAAVVIALIPMLLVFLFGQRYLQRGVLAGVGK
jgi:ABC-type glycerol-3-phosphate transport system permease component